MSIAALSITIEALDKASKPIQKIADEIENLEKRADGFKAVGENLTSMGQNMTEKVTAPVVAGLGLATYRAIEFESAMAGVNKAFGVAQGSKGAKALEDEVLSLTAALGSAPVEIAAIVEETGKLGVAKDQFREYVELVTAGGVAFDMTADQAGSAFADLTNVMGYFNAQTGAVDIGGLSELADTINYFADNGATSEAAITDVLTRAGGATRQFGLLNTEATALAASFLNLGADSSTVGTAINGILPILQNATQGTPKFKQALDDIGISAEQMEKNIAQDASGAILTFLEAVKSSGDTSIITRMFGQGSDASLLTSLVSNLDAVKGSFQDIENVEAGSMMATFAEQGKTTENVLGSLHAVLQIISTTVGQAMVPAINSMGRAITPIAAQVAFFLRANPRLVQIAVVVGLIAAAIGPLLIVLGSVISAVGTIMGAVATVKVALLGMVPVFSAVMAFLAPLKVAIMGAGAAIAAITSPITIAIAAAVALGIAAVLIVRNWSRIGPMLQAAGQKAMAVLQGLGAIARAAGANIIKMLAAGITGQIGVAIAAAKNVAKAVMSVLPNSPVPTGPLTVLNNSATGPGAKIVDMVAAGINARADSLGNALGSVMQPAANGGSSAGLFTRSAPLQQPTSGGNVFNITVNAGGASGDVVAELEQKLDELMARYGARQERLSYG